MGLFQRPSGGNIVLICSRSLPGGVLIRVRSFLSFSMDCRVLITNLLNMLQVNQSLVINHVFLIMLIYAKLLINLFIMLIYAKLLIMSFQIKMNV